MELSERGEWEGELVLTKTGSEVRSIESEGEESRQAMGTSEGV